MRHKNVVEDPAAIRKGDTIIADGHYATVESITKYLPRGRKRPENCPIRGDFIAWAFKTDKGTRWVGQAVSS